MFGNKQIKFNDGNFVIQNKLYNLTDGLLELLFQKEPNANLITTEDYDVMKEIIPVTQVHRKIGEMGNFELTIQKKIIWYFALINTVKPEKSYFAQRKQERIYQII